MSGPDPGSIRAFLADDHARLDGLLHRAVAASGDIDHAAYEEFRAGLLRHIAIEEKVLLPEVRRRRGSEFDMLVRQLRADHAAIAALLVPTPTDRIIATIRTVLDEHNPLEEDDGGLYEICDELPDGDAHALVARARAVPAVRLAPHFDGARAHEHIADLLRARAAVRRA